MKVDNCVKLSARCIVKGYKCYAYGQLNIKVAIAMPYLLVDITQIVKHVMFNYLHE